MTFISEIKTNLNDWYDQQQTVGNKFNNETNMTTTEESTPKPQVLIMGMQPLKFGLVAFAFIAAAYAGYKIVNRNK